MTDRTDELRALMTERVLVMDGATGTMLQSKNLGPADFGGPDLEGCNEILVETRPDVILDVHRAYLAAGADIIETNTFGGTPLVLAEYGLGDRAEALNTRAAELARLAADEASTVKKPRFVAGSVGPTTKSLVVTGGVTFTELREHFRRQIRGLVAGGVDLLLIETCQDTLNTKAALLAAEDVFAEAGERRPVGVSGTIEPMGTMLAGQTAEALAVSLDHVDLLFLGLNCATGPEFMTDHLRTLHHLARCPLSCYPNAGLPDEEGRYGETPDGLAQALERFVDRGWLNVVGGCCGTTDAHVRSMAAMVQGKRPRPMPVEPRRRVFYSGIEVVESTEDNRPLLVGERTNVIGSRKFRRLVAEGAWDEAAEIARRQARGGAQIIDVCLQDPDGDEFAAIDAFYARLCRMNKLPLMIDTTDPEAVELALTHSQGKAIVNSINLEDGEERLKAVCPLLIRYGAAVVVGCIDEDPDQAQAFTRERKLEVAVRLHGLLTGAYGLAETDLIFDPLVFPAASGDENYVGGAVETIEGLRLIKEEYPNSRTILGISNVSFGLPTAAREVVNSVFLYLATRAGLDLAIVNTERLERYASIPEDDRRMAEDLLLNRPPEDLPEGDPLAALVDAPEDWREQSPEQRAAINRLHIARLTERFRGARRTTAPAEDLPAAERAARCVVEGTRDGLVEALDELLASGLGALEIINGPLMDGMSEVGRLFNDNQLIVAEVLQSAEAMKLAVGHLEPHLEAGESAHRGRVVLATVKGDVHDIGKNLVHIILANNGWEVVDLGIKVPPERLIQAVREYRPDAVGLSGLLVKSAQQMVVTAADLRDAGLQVPILVGGAALSEKFTRTKIAPVAPAGALYCADAMAGLSTLNGLGELTGAPEAAVEAESASAPDPVPASAQPARKAKRFRTGLPPLPLPDVHRHVRTRLPDLRELWSWINPQMLYGKHLGLRGSYAKKMAERDDKARALTEAVAAVQTEALEWMRVGAVWRFFEAEAEGESIHVFEPGESAPRWTWTFPRQHGGGLCLADLVAVPVDGVRDSLAVFVVTAGAGVRDLGVAAREGGEFLRSHVIQALALETAEAAAEWLHRRLREDWGFADSPDTTMMDRFKARYRGRRYSFGYPACPDLDGQLGIWELLDPDEIGVQLTDGMMMDPEASVSALVFHHPDATYFSAP
jgi:5-methyltetrahydrofolate--homocysteine methyltransferase